MTIYLYGRLLLKETESARGGTLEICPTAAAVCEFICKGLADLEVYRDRPPLIVEPLDRMAINLIVAAGTAAQFKAFADLKLHIAPA